jgi:transcriptional regulator with XRE-family HTH domain
LQESLSIAKMQSAPGVVQVSEAKPIFDFEGFYRALDATRASRNLTWKQVGLEAQVNPSTLARMSQGKRPDADGLAALAAWSSLNPADFVTSSRKQRTQQSESLARISQLLRQDERLSSEGAKALEEILKAAYAQLAKRS